MLLQLGRGLRALEGDPGACAQVAGDAAEGGQLFEEGVLRGGVVTAIRELADKLAASIPKYGHILNDSMCMHAHVYACVPIYVHAFPCICMREFQQQHNTIRDIRDI